MMRWVRHIKLQTYAVLHFVSTTKVNFFPLWRFDPIPGHDLPLRGFAITLIGQTTLGKSPLDDDQLIADTST